MTKKDISLIPAIVLVWILCLLAVSGCAQTQYLKGLTPAGEKVYLGPVAIENTEPYQSYLISRRTDVDTQNYIFKRLRSAADLQFYHDGSWYSALEAYRGGMWLMRKRYKKGQDARQFIREHVERSDAGELRLVKYPDGSIQIGAYVLYNELDLLEATLKSDPKA